MLAVAASGHALVPMVVVTGVVLAERVVDHARVRSMTAVVLATLAVGWLLVG